jgi:hypothetical protein
MADAGRLSRVTRRLGVVVGGGFFVLGVVELIMRLEKPLVLLFWLPTLWGGAALVLASVFLRAARGQLAVVLVILGAFLGGLASAWTVLMPILALLLVILTIVCVNRRELKADKTGSV